MMNINEKISFVTLGTVQLGLEYGIANKTGKPSRDVAGNILKKAYEGGITSFDTSIEYGDSEIILGDFFESYNAADKPYISSKFKMPDEHGSDADIERTIYSLCEKSLDRLKIDSIPLYMLHNPKDMTCFGKIVPRTLKKLIADKYIKAAGVSVYTVDEAEEMLRDDVYSAIQLPMNIFDDRFIKSGMIKTLASSDIQIFVRSVFLQGLFFMQPDLLPKNFNIAARYLKLLHDFSKEVDITISKLAYSYIRGIEGVSSIVLGAETVDQISDNISLLSCPAIDQEKRQQLEVLLKDVPIEEIMVELKRKKLPQNIC